MNDCTVSKRVGSGYPTHIAENRNKYDIICLQETHLKPDKNFSVAGYNVVRGDRVEGSKGGVITLVRENLNYTELSNPANIECIRIQKKTCLFISHGS